MKIVVSEVMRRFEFEPEQAAGELSIRRSITVSPKQGGSVILRTRRTAGPLASSAVQVPVELAA
jgi:hypothetical protein